MAGSKWESVAGGNIFVKPPDGYTVFDKDYPPGKSDDVDWMGCYGLKDADGVEAGTVPTYKIRVKKVSGKNKLVYFMPGQGNVNIPDNNDNKKAGFRGGNMTEGDPPIGWTN